MIIPSPVGNLSIEIEDGAIVACSPTDEPLSHEVPAPLEREAARQLQEYFDGTRRTFDLPLNPCRNATPFRRRVWDVLRTIPYGATVSYGRLAAAIGNPKACRAVAQACHFNSIAIIIPCHRVIASDGTIGGYEYGTAAKKILLDLEHNNNG